MKGKPMKNGFVSAEEFIRQHEKASSNTELAKVVHSNPTAVSVRACQYRKAGIALKYYRRRTPRIDVPALNKLLKELRR